MFVCMCVYIYIINLVVFHIVWTTNLGSFNGCPQFHYDG